MAETNWKYYSAGLGHVGSYQAAGAPWLSSSFIEKGQNVVFTFPYVTKSITVINTGSVGQARVSFVPTASMNQPGGCVWELNSAEDAMTMNVKCTQLHVSENGTGATGVRVFAELTGIETGRMYALTGSGISE